jgi:hypothetical protein
VPPDPKAFAPPPRARRSPYREPPPDDPRYVRPEWPKGIAVAVALGAWGVFLVSRAPVVLFGAIAMSVPAIAKRVA